MDNQLHNFLETFLSTLLDHRLHFCILRNHESLPLSNSSKDIDILVCKNQLKEITQVLASLNDTSILRMLRRSYVVSFFIFLPAFDQPSAVIKLDLVTELGWKGFKYLNAKAVLNRAITPIGKPTWLKVAAPMDEAVISFFSPFFSSGLIKEQYITNISTQCRSSQHSFTETVSPFLGERTATFASLLLNGNISKIQAMRTPLLLRLILKCFLKAPVDSLYSLFQHCRLELVIFVSKANNFTICLLGPDGAGKSTLARHLRQKLTNCSSEVNTYHLKPFLFFKSRYLDLQMVGNPHTAEPRSFFSSFLKLMLWLSEVWIDYLFSHRKNLTITIYDRYFHDILVDPRRYRFGGPESFVRLMCRLIPQPDMFIIVDTPSNIIQERKSEVPFQETERQVIAYRKLASELSHSILVNGNQSIQLLVNETRNAILQAMKQQRIEMPPS